FTHAVTVNAGFVGNTGTGTGTGQSQNLQPYQVVNYIIRVSSAADPVPPADSGWITVGSGGTAPAYGTGFADANSGADYKTRFRKVGTTVTVAVCINKTATAGTIFTLPAGFAPSVPVFGALTISNAAFGASAGFSALPNSAVAVNSSGLANGVYY